MHIRTAVTKQIQLPQRCQRTQHGARLGAHQASMLPGPGNHANVQGMHSMHTTQLPGTINSCHGMHALLAPAGLLTGYTADVARCSATRLRCKLCCWSQQVPVSRQATAHLRLAEMCCRKYCVASALHNVCACTWTGMCPQKPRFTQTKWLPAADAA
jgi:hypothetical protein